MRFIVRITGNAPEEIEVDASDTDEAERMALDEVIDSFELTAEPAGEVGERDDVETD